MLIIVNKDERINQLKLEIEEKEKRPKHSFQRSSVGVEIGLNLKNELREKNVHKILSKRNTC